MLPIRLIACALAVAAPVPSPAAPPAAERHYEHEESGLVVDMPEPFAIVRPRRDSNYDPLVDVESRTGQPPLAGTSRAVCSVGFTKAPPDLGLDQADFDAEGTVRAKLDESRKVLTQFGNAVERAEVFEHDGVRGLEFTMTPSRGPDAASTRQYMAIVDRPAGRVTTVCATRADAMPTALDAFRAIRDGAKLNAR